jgi:hypothetical protein
MRLASCSNLLVSTFREFPKRGSIHKRVRAPWVLRDYFSQRLMRLWWSLLPHDSCRLIERLEHLDLAADCLKPVYDLTRTPPSLALGLLGRAFTGYAAEDGGARQG